MKPVEFPQQTNKLAKTQPQYRVLPVCIRPTGPLPDDPKQFICKYELNDFELAMIAQTRGFYFSQFGFGFQPILPQIESPFKSIAVEYKINSDGDFSVWVPLEGGGFWEDTNFNAALILDNILHRFPELDAESIVFIEKPELGVDENGKLRDL